MRLQPGMRLGPYRIERRAGSGGMGEVYRARDTRLARSVAIKVLAAGVAADARQRARLEQEARAISALNHPHICALHDLGREDDLDYLVLEFCEGQTLADRLARGPLPLVQVLRYGIEIAGALSAAHRAGIVHRDLKPSNVMLTDSGVKLLDFGISKPRRPPAGDTDPDDTTSFRLPPTEEGRPPGTLQYMAPEVLRGEEADARTDIFAFGLVLYEMLTGKRAFSGDSRASVIASILEREPPPLSEVRPETPPALESVITRCLGKRREDRWESAHDVSEMLRLIPRLDVPSSRPSRRRAIIAASGAAVLAFVAAVVAIERTQHDDDEARVIRFSIPLNDPDAPEGDAGASVGDGWGASPVAITADGKRIAYTATRESYKIYLRSIDSADSRPVEATEFAGLPFFSPDGRWLGFFNSGLLSKVAVDGGTPQVIAAPAVARGASWGSDGNIYFTVSLGGGLWRVAEKGGPAQQLTKPDAAAGENSHRWPQLLPDREHILFTIRTGRITSYDDASIAVLALTTGKWKVVLEGGTYAQYVSTGHVLFGRGGALYAIPFDLTTQSVTGPARKMIDGVAGNPSSGAMHYAVAANGDLVYVSGRLPEKRTELITLDRTGRQAPLVTIGLRLGDVRVSPDGTKLALHSREANDSIWMHDLRTGSSMRVSAEGSEHCCPVWSADGSRILYASFGETARMMARRADGTGEEEELARSEYIQPWSCSPDGQLAIYETHGAGTQCDLWLVPLRGVRTPRVFLHTPFKESFARFSPDGKWIAYASVDSNTIPQIYVRSAVSGDRRWQISVEPAGMPVWSADGASLFFADGRRIFAADIHDATGELRPEKPRVLFSLQVPMRFGYDVLGDRFVTSLDANRQPRSVNVVLNWKRELAEVRPGS